MGARFAPMLRPVAVDVIDPEEVDLAPAAARTVHRAPTNQIPNHRSQEATDM